MFICCPQKQSFGVAVVSHLEKGAMEYKYAITRSWGSTVFFLQILNTSAIIVNQVSKTEALPNEFQSFSSQMQLK